MEGLGYKSCLADPDLWYKPQVRPKDNVHYYSYILCYVDDIMVIHHDALEVLTRIDKYFTLKPSSIGDPDIYLGAKLRQQELPNEVWCWSISPAKYVREAVKNCEMHLSENYDEMYALKKEVKNPFPWKYEPSINVSHALDDDLSSYYQSLIGICRWMIELGRIDIATEISLLSAHNAYPREGHFQALLHVMSYLKHKYNSRLSLDPTYPYIDYDKFNDGADWASFYSDATEAIPANAPKPLGKHVDMCMMVDSDHAGDKATRQSRSGYLIFLNMALIDWLSKKQSTIESSVFGAEFVSMRLGIEACRGIRYKLRMMGVPLMGPVYIYGDNMSVIHNTSKPESVLKKKSNSICYHAVRESVAAGESLTSHISTHYNLSDLLTKVLYGEKRRQLVRGLLCDIHDFD